MSLSAAHNTHSLFTHLSLSYLAIYAVCAALLFVINARVISASSRAFDRQDVRSDSLEYVEILGHDNSGNWLAEEVAIENLPPSTLFAIRILSAQGSVCYAATRDDAARVGFSDAQIYSELAQAPQTRAIPFTKAEASESVAVMRLWQADADKSTY